MFRFSRLANVLGSMALGLSSLLFTANLAVASDDHFHPVPTGPAVPVGNLESNQPGPLENSHYLLQMAFQYQHSNHDLAVGLATSSADEFANFLKRAFDNYLRAGVFDYAFAQTLFNEYDRYSEEAQKLPFLWQSSQLRIVNRALVAMETKNRLAQAEDLTSAQKEALKHAEAVLRRMDHSLFWGTCEELLR